jgi:hypothetical protein
MDLLLPEVPRKSSIRPADNPKLEIKRDAKGLVSVLGATQQAVTSAEQLMATVEQVGGGGLSLFACACGGGGLGNAGKGAKSQPGCVRHVHLTAGSV